MYIRKKKHDLCRFHNLLRARMMYELTPTTTSAIIYVVMFGDFQWFFVSLLCLAEIARLVARRWRRLKSPNRRNKEANDKRRFEGKFISFKQPVESETRSRCLRSPVYGSTTLYGSVNARVNRQISAHADREVFSPTSFRDCCCHGFGLIGYHALSGKFLRLHNCQQISTHSFARSVEKAISESVNKIIIYIIVWGARRDSLLGDRSAVNT